MKMCSSVSMSQIGQDGVSGYISLGGVSVVFYTIWGQCPLRSRSLPIWWASWRHRTHTHVNAPCSCPSVFGHSVCCILLFFVTSSEEKLKNLELYSSFLAYQNHLLTCYSLLLIQPFSNLVLKNVGKVNCSQSWALPIISRKHAGRGGCSQLW